jgi:hypothetical protein
MTGEPVKSQFSTNVVKGFANRDGKKTLFVVEVAGGLFCYVEECELYQPPASVSGYYYWAETYRSGLYRTPEEAEREARVAVPWLREEIQN